MNVEVKPKTSYRLSAIEQEITYSAFSVKKPENIIGTSAVFKTASGDFIQKDYDSVLKNEMKKKNYISISFVNHDNINMEFSIRLFSDMMELMMETTLKCQMKIKDVRYVAGNNHKEVTEEIAQVINEQLNLYVTVCNKQEIDLIGELIQAIPAEVKRIELDEIQMESCRLIDTNITDRGKRDKVKTTLHEAINNKDLFTLAENEILMDRLFGIQKKIDQNRKEMNQSHEEEKITSLENDNKTFELLTQRYQKLKETGMIAPDITMEAFMKALGEKDAVFTQLTLEKQEELKRNVQENDKKEVSEEKSYFE